MLVKSQVKIVLEILYVGIDVPFAESGVLFSISSK